MFTTKKYIENHKFIEGIMDGMLDWVRVLDRNDNVLYMNRAMTESLGAAKTGSKCYYAVGRDTPCENCISRQAVFDGKSHEKDETIGARIFSVMSSPVKSENGEIIGVVEVLRDTTEVRMLQSEIMNQNVKLKDDLLIARRLQCSLLPKNFIEDKVAFSYLYNPCEALGGDFLDIFRIDEAHIGIYVADVSGHGVPASMLTIFLRSSLDKKFLSPARALEELFREFNASKLGEDLYITIFYAILNLENKCLVYSNAGHNVSPVVFNPSEPEEFELLRLPGIPISRWVEQAEYIDGHICMKTGDRLFLYTDGIIEMKDSIDRQFGEEYLLELLLGSRREPSGTLNEIFEAALKFNGTDNLSEVLDDITIALLEIK